MDRKLVSVAFILCVAASSVFCGSFDEIGNVLRNKLFMQTNNQNGLEKFSIKYNNCIEDELFKINSDKYNIDSFKISRFWYLALTTNSAIREDCNEKKVIEVNKIVMRLIMLIGLNGAHVSQYNNHALIVAQLGFNEKVLQFESIEADTTTGALLSNQLSTNFVFSEITTRNSNNKQQQIDALDLLLELKTPAAYRENDNEAKTYTSSADDRINYISNLFDYFTYDDKTCVINVDLQKTEKTNDGKKNYDGTGAILKKFSQCFIKVNEKANERLQNIYRLGINSYFDGKNISENFKTNNVLNQVLGIELDLKNIQGPDEWPLTYNVEWKPHNLDACKHGELGTICTGKGSLAVRVIQDAGTLKKIFYIADEITTRLRGTEDISKKLRQGLFNLLIADSNTTRREKALTLIKKFLDYPKDLAQDKKNKRASFVENVKNKLTEEDNRKLENHKTSSAPDYLLPPVDYGIGKDAKNNMASRLFCGFKSDDRFSVYDKCNTLIDSLIYLQHELLRQQVKKNITPNDNATYSNVLPKKECRIPGEFKNAFYFDFGIKSKSAEINTEELMEQLEKHFNLDKLPSKNKIKIEKLLTKIKENMKNLTNNMEVSSNFYADYYNNMLIWAQQFALRLFSNRYGAKATTMENLIEKTTPNVMGSENILGFFDSITGTNVSGSIRTYSKIKKRESKNPSEPLGKDFNEALVKLIEGFNECQLYGKPTQFREEERAILVI